MAKNKNKYYAWFLPDGKAGICESWEECEKHCSGQPGEKHKAFKTYEEACEFAYPCKDLNISDLKTELIDGHFIGSDSAAFNYPLDLPDSVNKAIYSYYGVDSLSDIPGEKRYQLVGMSRPFGNGQTTDYSQRAEAYMLAYMPVNFYKIWKPLRELVSQEVLPIHCRILELGTGPGTAVMGLMTFYSLLAIDNPDVRFLLDITSVEREGSFKPLFSLLTGATQSDLPANLNVKIDFVNADAFDFALENKQSFDMLLESNMINEDEDISEEATEKFISVIENCLRPKGLLIMIEPGTKSLASQLWGTEELLGLNGLVMKIICKPQISAVDISGIKLCEAARKIRLRFKEDRLHWFSCMVLQNEVDE